MSRKLHSRRVALTTTVILCTSVVVFAQNEPQRKQEPARSGAKRQEQKRQERERPNVITARKIAGDAATSSRADSQIAACTMIENNLQVDLAQFASERSQNAEVKDFAQKVARQHSQFNDQLQKFASAGGYDIHQSAGREARGLKSRLRSQPGTLERSADRQKEQDRKTESSTENPGASATSASPGDRGLDFVQVKREIADRCLQSARQALEEKQADKFDRCYIGGQVMAHMAMVDALEVLKNHASGELRPVLEEGLKTAQAHLDEAKRLEKSLESSPK